MSVYYVVLELPFPPSVNHYWRHVGPKVLISREGRQYRERVKGRVLLAGEPRLEGAIAVTIAVMPPDKRRRDLDNLFKAVLDALAAAGVYEDDSQIDCLMIERRGVVREGGLIVTLNEVTAEDMEDPDE